MKLNWLAPGRRFALPCAAGALQALCFAPFGWWPLQFLIFAWFFLYLRREGGFTPAWAFGSGWLLASVYWLFIAMHRFGNMPAALAALATLIFALAMGLPYGLAGWLAKRLQGAQPALSWLLLSVPVAFTLGEWLRCWLFTGFPWVLSGYAQIDAPLAGFAPLAGVNAVGFAVMLCGGALAAVWQTGQQAQWRRAALCLALPLLLLSAGWLLKQHSWSQPLGQPLQVRLLQGNIAQDEKFARERIIDSLQLYQRMIMGERADIIATPETAFPLFMHLLPAGFISDLHDWARSNDSHLLLGVPLTDGPNQYANSVLGLSPRSNAYYRYDKRHLVPFGEFIPPGFRWFVDMMQIPLGDFARGPWLQAPFAVKDQFVLPNVCYEDLFGLEIASQLGEAAQAGKPVASILLNVSNLAWYGQSSAIPQHLQIARMRSLETGRPMLRATNTGATAVIDARGEVQKLLAYDQQGVLRATVQGMQGLTPYARFGEWPLLALLAGLLAWQLRRLRKEA
ncbi:apolipoprotein N-acyltransferase [Massilia sp. W12]|uniref:apolipoprotein N-acyltransferase n=1 Tax=Massilia sp. W12 TaxID=3126507 RepID=UPI0030CD6017